MDALLFWVVVSTTTLFWAVVIALYFLPAIVAVEKSKKNAGAIAVLNLLLGWTVIGWIVSLVWAATND